MYSIIINAQRKTGRIYWFHVLGCVLHGLTLPSCAGMCATWFDAAISSQAPGIIPRQSVHEPMTEVAVRGRWKYLRLFWYFLVLFLLNKSETPDMPDVILSSAGT